MSQKRPNVLLLAKVRQLHSYFAMFAAPSIIFFCATGVLQLFSFHEAHGAYRPPAIIQALGSLHKNQTLAVRHAGEGRGRDDEARPAARPEGASGGGAARPGDADDTPPAKADRGSERPDKTAHWTPAQVALKAVFTIASLAALVSTGLGIWVGLSIGPRRKWLAWLLAAGVAVPVIIAVL